MQIIVPATIPANYIDLDLTTTRMRERRDIVFVDEVQKFGRVSNSAR